MRTLVVLATLTLALAPPVSADPPRNTSTDLPTGTIAFASLAPRGWDLYLTDVETEQTRRLTDHPALGYNATFSADGKQFAFVSEREGNPELFVSNRDGSGLKRLTSEFGLDDHPVFSPDGKRIAFVSTRQPADKPGRAWNAVFVMNADGSEVRRLSPKDAADYSPAWSPRDDLIALASGSGATGGIDLFVMKPDGTGRRLVVKDGGWPSFSTDGNRLFFHSKREGKWGVWSVKLDGSGLERLTPPDIEAFTPRASADGKRLALAVRQGEYRQIEVMDLESRKRRPITKEAIDHWNPSFSPDGRHVVYHKTTAGRIVPNVELWGAPPRTRLQLARLAGAFPAFSPDGKRLALTGGKFAQLDVMNSDGSGRKTIHPGKYRGLFSISWAHEGDRIAFSEGGVFQGPEGKVDVVLIRPDGSSSRKLSENAGNNGFPSFSPDGKRLVFRSGRDGSKNLYIANQDGTGVRRLTEGKWTDTMADWSPTGEWIAFASNRGTDFEVWLIKPDGSGLRKLVGGGGRNNHPHFSPDGKWIVFTSQRAGYSAEEIALPRQPQPYGDLFATRLDGTGLLRLTHNGFEEGTPAWGPVLKLKPSSEGHKDADDY